MSHGLCLQHLPPLSAPQFLSPRQWPSQRVKKTMLLSVDVYTPEMAASHFLQVQVKSQVISLQVQVKSQVISLQVQVKSQVIWSDVKSSHKSFGQTSSQVTSHLVQTQVKSQVSLSKYKSSRTLFCPAVIRNQGQSSNQSTVSYSQRYMKWSMVLNNLMYKYGVPYMYTH